jgi:hypothetical protein
MTYGRPPRRADERVRRAYEAAGWTIGPTGKPVAPIGFGQLRPSVHPPGLSTLPEPRRRRWREDKPPSDVPPKAKTMSEIPKGLDRAYDYTAAGFIRNAVGDALADYRDKKTREPNAEPLTRRRAMTREQYALLQALATPGAEARHFTRAAATGRITIQD